MQADRELKSPCPSLVSDEEYAEAVKREEEYDEQVERRRSVLMTGVAGAAATITGLMFVNWESIKRRLESVKSAIGELSGVADRKRKEHALQRLEIEAASYEQVARDHERDRPEIAAHMWRQAEKSREEVRGLRSELESDK